MGISIDSGTRLKASMVPLMSCMNSVIKVKNPKSENISCMVTFNDLKYVTKLLRLRLKYGLDRREDLESREKPDA